MLSASGSQIAKLDRELVGIMHLKFVFKQVIGDAVSLLQGGLMCWAVGIS